MYTPVGFRVYTFGLSMESLGNQFIRRGRANWKAPVARGAV